MSGRLLRSTAVFSAMTFLSRISGLVRDQVYAQVFGASAAMDAFVVAFRIPNFMRRLSAEGSFSMAFVPVLTELKQKGDDKAVQDFLNHIAGTLLAAVLVVVGYCTAFYFLSLTLRTLPLGVYATDRDFVGHALDNADLLERARLAVERALPVLELTRRAAASSNRTIAA